MNRGKAGIAAAFTCFMLCLDIDRRTAASSFFFLLSNFASSYSIATFPGINSSRFLITGIENVGVEIRDKFGTEDGGEDGSAVSHS